MLSMFSGLSGAKSNAIPTILGLSMVKLVG